MEVVKATVIQKPKEPKPPKRKRVWDNYKVITEVQKSDRIKLVIAAAVRDGVKYINIREFYLRQKDGVWKPGRDGITVPLMIPIEQGTKIIEPYWGFVDALTATMRELKEMPLYDEANAVYYVKEDK